jgi:tetratricopeptide (TPR) repeat protein
MLQTQLAQLQDLQLLSRILDEELTYAFKHALTQEAVYQSLLFKTRQDLHHAVAVTYEQLYANSADENAALLAYHFELAQDSEKALHYLQRAARWARRAAAHREEAALLGRAIVLAEQTGQPVLAAELHAQRGHAFTSLTQWANARTELEAALAGLPTEHAVERAQVLADLAIVCHWLLDVPTTRRYANEALTLAEQLGREDLAAGALCALALADSSDGLTQAGLKNFELAFARAGNPRTLALAAGQEMYGIIQYWFGDFQQSIDRERAAVRLAEELNDSATFMRALGDLGLALMGSGRYAEALQTFAETREFGRKHDLLTWTARAIAMESGCHLELYDFRGAETLAEEARDLARSSNFIGPVVSAGIDLLFNYARRWEPGLAQRLVPEVGAEVERGKGSHEWLWRMRFAQVRAELALAQQNWAEAFTAADEAISRGRATGRVKYIVAGMVVRGQALANQGHRDKALGDLRTAVKRARKLGDPGVFLRAAAALLAVEGDDTVSAEARAVAQQTAASLPTLNLREQFQAFVSELF